MEETDLQGEQKVICCKVSVFLCNSVSGNRLEVVMRTTSHGVGVTSDVVRRGVCVHEFATDLKIFLFYFWGYWCPSLTCLWAEIDCKS